MPRLPILEYPDPRLRLPSAPVTAFDGSLGRLIEDLLDTLAGTPSIALSAPQLDDRRRVLVIDPDGTRADPQIFVNPEILARSRPGIVEESCLSVPGVSGNVIRSTRLTVRAQDRTGAWLERDLESMAAVCLQHEVDHLDGTLFLDRLHPLRRLLFRAGERGRRRRAAG